MSALRHMQKKLIYASRKRGILETTLVLSNFVHRNVQAWDMQQCQVVARLLHEMDWDLWEMLNGKRHVPNDFAAVVTQIRETVLANKEGKGLREPEVLVLDAE